jgi:hypothetical protein
LHHYAFAHAQSLHGRLIEEGSHDQLMERDGVLIVRSSGLALSLHPL